MAPQPTLGVEVVWAKPQAPNGFLKKASPPTPAMPICGLCHSSVGALGEKAIVSMAVASEDLPYISVKAALVLGPELCY